MRKANPVGINSTNGISFYSMTHLAHFFKCYNNDFNAYSLTGPNFYNPGTGTERDSGFGRGLSGPFLLSGRYRHSCGAQCLANNRAHGLLPFIGCRLQLSELTAVKLDRQELVFFCRSCHQAARSRPLQGIDTGKGKQVQRDTKQAAVAATGGGSRVGGFLDR